MCGNTKTGEPNLTPKERRTTADLAVKIAEGLIEGRYDSGGAWVSTFGSPLNDLIVFWRYDKFFSHLPREAAAMALLIIAEELEHG